MAEPIVIARHDDTDLALLPALANRHGAHHRRHRHRQDGHAAGHRRAALRASASRSSWPTSRATSPASRQAGRASPKLKERLDRARAARAEWAGCPVTFWDVFGEQGHPVRATISDMGPLLLARLLNLNETQEGVLTLAFKIADDNGLLLLDLKDLRALLQYRRRQRREIQDQVRQRLAGVDRRDPARPARSSSSRAATGSSASRCSTSTTCCRPMRRAAASSTSSPPTS